MKMFVSAVILLSAPHGLVSEAIIGYDGKEVHYGVNRDGLHIPILGKLRQQMRHPSSQPKLRRWDAQVMPRVLNQGPVVDRLHNLATATHHRRAGVSKADNLASTDAMNIASDSIKALNKKTGIEKNMWNSAHGFRKSTDHVVVRRSAAEEFAEEFMGAPPGGLTPREAPAAAPGPAPAPMPMEAGTPEQGFSGKMVEHENMVTMTKDWRGEYGRHAKGLTSYEEICALYPDNQWCHDRGYHKTTPVPSTATKYGMVASIVAMTMVAVHMTLS